jgi:stage V sporulation protein G
VKVIEGKTGIFIAMPSRKTKTGDYKDVAHPINSEFRNELQKKILAAFLEMGENVETTELEPED